jgi:predicted permease
LFAATGVLLGLACLNVASLFLARGSARDREISTRLALGASRGRIARQLLADSVLLAFTGGMAGVMLAPLVMRTLIAFLPGGGTGKALHSAISGQLLLFGFLVSVATGVITGLAPAVRASGGAPITRLKERGVTSFGGLHLRRVIVIGQVAFTLILVIGAALFVRTLTALLNKGPGFATSSLITFNIDPVKNGYAREDANRIIREIHDQLRASPVTQSADIARNALLTGGTWNDPLTIQDGQRSITEREVHLNAITPGFFATLGARMVAGRGFEERDTRTSSEGGRPVAIVNEAFVKRYMGGRSPLGARIGMGSGLDVKPDIEIVGVVSDISYRGMRQEWEQAYFPMVSDKFYEGANFYVRIHGSPDAAASTVRAILRRADPTLSLNGFRTVDEQVRRALSTERMLATLSASFGTVALLLSLVGLYGVMSFVVSQRTREIGIRLALGATRGGAVWLVLRGALIIVGTGIAVALPCVWMLGGLVQSQLYGVQATDPMTIVAATLVLSSAALAAALIPACRASAVSPTEALRFE